MIEGRYRLWFAEVASAPGKEDSSSSEESENEAEDDKATKRTKAEREELRKRKESRMREQEAKRVKRALGQLTAQEVSISFHDCVESSVSSELVVVSSLP